MTPDRDQRPPTCAVIVCTYTMERRADLDACLDALERQRRTPDEVIVVVDHNPELLATVRTSVRTIPNAGPRGLSSARNTGLAATTADLVVFIDDDAVADPAWLEELLAPFRHPDVAAVGGRIEPSWPTDRPNWFPPHLDWTVGCTNPDAPEVVGPVRNVFGASAAFRRSALERVGGFPVELGRVGADVAGCEETQVCIRIRQTAATDQVVYAPRALVSHRVTPGRARVGYVLRRCLGEGRSKARLAVTVGAARATGDERSYAIDIVRAVARDAVGGLREHHRLGRAAVLSAGLACASFGYASERMLSGGRRRWE